MVEQSSETSVATSSPSPNWWELHSNPLQTWPHPGAWQPRAPTSSSSCEEDISTTSFTNASNHSGLTDDSPRELAEPSSAAATDLSGEPAAENHLWSQVLLSIGTGKEMRYGQDDGDNFLAALTSKNLTMFEPACDYLKKVDSSWEFSASPSFNAIEKQLSSYDGSSMEEGSPNPDMSKWSIAPPDPRSYRQIAPSPCSFSLNSSMQPGSSQMKQDPENPSAYNGLYGSVNQSYNMAASSQSSFLRSFNGVGYPHSASLMGDNSKHCYGLPEGSWTPTRHFADLISFGSCLSKPLMEFPASSKLGLKNSMAPENKKQGDEISVTKSNGRGTGVASEGKKKRTSEESSETLFKKPKHEGSTGSSVKVQAPKVKLGDRITALQQIVAPFGKTDTASVLLEAIGYIKFLHEQVQLLSNPYLKSGVTKDHSPWGALDRDSLEAKLDLRGRGLCLVPISCTPQVYRENTGPDYWTPTYRGCLYR